MGSKVSEERIHGKAETCSLGVRGNIRELSQQYKLGISQSFLSENILDNSEDVQIRSTSWAGELELARVGCALNYGLQSTSSHRTRLNRREIQMLLGQDEYKINLWSKKFQHDCQSLSADCLCQTCKSHSRSYIHHLLQVHEITAEVLLQNHNRHQLNKFSRDLDHQRFLKN